MKKYSYMAIGIAMLLGNRYVACLFNGNIGTAVGMVCVIIGAVLLSLSIKMIIDSESKGILSQIKEKTEALFTQSVQMSSYIDSSNKEMSDYFAQEIEYRNSDKEVRDKINNSVLDISKTLIDNGELAKCKYENIERTNKESKELLDSISKNVLELTKVPQPMMEAMDECIAKINEYMQNNSKLIGDMNTDTVSMLNTNLKGNRKNIDELIDSIEDYTDNISSNIEQLSKEYQSFEKTVNGLVENLTLMSQNDIKTLKEVING